jgi:hypothetical protein
MTEEDVSKTIGEAGGAAGAEALVLEGIARSAGMVGGVGAAADAVLAGGAAAEGLTAGAAAVGGAGVAAGVVGAFATGYWVGEKIDDLTGASDKLSSAAVDADPELALSASNDWDDAGTAWDRGDHLEAVGDGASAVGKFALGSAEAAIDGIGSVASDIGDAIFGGPSIFEMAEEAARRADEE